MAYALDLIAWIYAEAWLVKRRWRKTRWWLCAPVFDAPPFLALCLWIFVLPDDLGLWVCLGVVILYAPLQFGRSFAERRSAFDD